MADYHSLLMRAVANLPNAGTPATRAAIYGRARKALLEQLRSLRPPLPESDITREENALDAAIAEIEERYGSQQAAASSTPSPPAAPSPPAPAGKPGARPRRSRRNPPPPTIRPQSTASQRPAAPGSPRAPMGGPRFVGELASTAIPGSRQGHRRRRQARLSAAGAATSAADARAEPAGQQPAAAANRVACGEASRRDADGCAFAGSIPAGCCDGQPALLRIEGRPGCPIGQGTRAQRMRVCPEWRRSIRPKRSDRVRPTTGRRPGRRQLSRAATTKPCNRPRRRKWRPNSTAPAWRPDRRRRSSARSRRASMSPSRSACSGSRRRSSLVLFSRWREPRS